MKTSKLFSTTLAILVVLFVVSGVAVSICGAWRIDRNLTEQYQSKGTAIANSVASSCIELLLNRDSSTVQAMVDQYLDIQGIGYVFVVDRDGEIVSHTFSPKIPEEVRHLKGDRYQVTSRAVEVEGIGTCIDVAAPLLAGEVGFVHVGMDRRLIRAAIWSATMEQTAVMSAILLVALAASFVLVKRITLPLNQLAFCARELAKNDSTAGASKRADAALVPIAFRTDEVGQLAQAFRHLVYEVSRREQRLREVEKTLRESEARVIDENQRLVASIPCVLIGLDMEGRVSKWNSAAAEVFMMSSNIVLGRTLGELASTWDDRRLVSCVENCLAGERPANLDDFSFKRPDGRIVFLSTIVTPVACQDGTFHGALVLGTDITERRSLETQLSHAQKLESIGQLAAGIAHEINTPIQYVGDNVIFLKDAFAGFHELLEKQIEFVARAKDGKLDDQAIAGIEKAIDNADLRYLNEEIPRAIDQTLDGVGRVTKIVRAMKEFSHPGHEGKVAADVNKLIENTITVAHNEWKYVAEMVTDFDDTLPLVPCMAGEFNQVMLNLIINAAHAIAERHKDNHGCRGTITITTRASENGVEIRVRDTGTGIPEAARPKIFDPFFTTKPVGKGTGQGLAIAHAVIVKKHGGTLSFETKVGEGTTFIVHIPGAVRSVGTESFADFQLKDLALAVSPNCI